MAAPKHKPTGRRLDGSHYMSDKVVCVRGHKFEGDNIIDRHDPSHPNGGRMCRQCSRERAKLSSRVLYWRRRIRKHEGDDTKLVSHKECDECTRMWHIFAAHQKRLNAWRACHKMTISLDKS